MKEKIKADFKRHGISRINFYVLLKVFYFFPNPGLKFMLILRLLQHFRKRNSIIFLIMFIHYRVLKFKYGIDISYRTLIGDGFYIGHFGGIVVHGDSIIGKNCNISQGVTIGVLNHGKKIGAPEIGDNVFIGPGAKVLGNVKIGSNVVIGANAVVTIDVPRNFTVKAPDSLLLQTDLSEYYIHNSK